MQRVMNLEELTADYKSAIKNWNKERNEMQKQITQQNKIIEILRKRARGAEEQLFSLAFPELKDSQHK